MRTLKAALTAILLLQSAPALAVCPGEMACYGWLRDGSGLCGLFTVRNGLQKDFIKLETTQMCTLKVNNCMYCQPEERNDTTRGSLVLIPGQSMSYVCSKNGNQYDIYDEFKNNQWCINTFDGRTRENIDVICPTFASKREALEFGEKHCASSR